MYLQDIMQVLIDDTLGIYKWNGIPYTTGAAPVKYFNLQISLDRATAAKIDVDVVLRLAVERLMRFPFRPILSNTDIENLSISLSVTSHRFATRVGLRAIASVMKK